jgi:hypothetical protein
MVVGRIQIAPGSVGLPNLDERVADWLSVAVEDTPGDYDPLAKRLSSMLAREVGILSPYWNAPEHRPGSVVEPLVGQPDGLVFGSAQLSRAILRIEIGRFELDVLHGP